MWIPVETAYVTAERIGEIKQNNITGVSGTTDNQKAINYLISQGTYPMAVKITVPDNDEDPTNNEVFYRGILYEFTNDTSTTPNTVTISSYADFSLDTNTATNSNYYQTTAEYYREPAFLKNTSNGDASSYNNIGLTQEILQNEYNEMIEAVAENRRLLGRKI